MTSFAEIARENVEKYRVLCNNQNIDSALKDAEFRIVAMQEAANFRAKANSVKSESSKAKWSEIANVWEEAAGK